jgi:hypothetical protein
MKTSIELNKKLSILYSYLYHIFSISIAYVTPVIIGTGMLIPYSGPYSLMLPMMVFMWSWKTYALMIIIILVFKNTIETKILPSYFICCLIAYLSFYYFSPILLRSFIGFDIIGASTEHKIKSGLFIIGFPLIYSIISLSLYFLMIKRKIKKENKKIP